MSLLRDEELIAAITAQPPATRYVEGVVLPVDPADRYSKDSPVQASSIDLHIGNVYLPGEKEPDLGGAQNPRENYSLETGGTRSRHNCRETSFTKRRRRLWISPPPGFLSKAY